MDNEESKVKHLRKVLTKGSSAKGEKHDRENVVSIFGSEGIAIGNNNTINITKTETVVQRTQIDPKGGELTPHQKQRLQGLVDGIVGAAPSATHAGTWKRFQRRFHINSYHALPAHEYEAAKKYLQMLYGRAKKGEL